MFVRNQTPLRAALPRGYVGEDDAVAALVVEARFQLSREGLVPSHEDRRPTALPDILRCALWSGTSVTVSGTVHGPAQPPYVQPVSLRVGGELRRLIVFGERRWGTTLGGALVASKPAPFDAVPLTFERAFGGWYDEPPGLDAETGLPTPGGRVAFPLNETGIGFYPNAAAAYGQPLPNVEHPHQLIATWDARPEPGGLAPCPSLKGLRAPTADDGEDAAHLLFQHVAPRALVFPTLVPGTEIAVSGVGRAPIGFAVPGFQADVATKPALRRAGSWSTRAVHVDVDEGMVLVVQGYSFTYTSSTAPWWIYVTAAR